MLHVGQNVSSTRVNIYPLISCKYLFKYFKLLNLKDINLLPTISFLLWNTESKSMCSPFSCSFHPKEWQPSAKCLNTQFLSLKLNKYCYLYFYMYIYGQLKIDIGGQKEKLKNFKKFYFCQVHPIKMHSVS